jgi:hypothetical protein
MESISQEAGIEVKEKPVCSSKDFFTMLANFSCGKILFKLADLRMLF